MRPADAGAFALPAAAAALLAAALLFGGGSSDTRLFWIGGAALLVAAVAVVWRPPALTGPALGFLLCLGALAAWQALTIEWSIEPSRSWDYANRGVVYFGFAALGVLLAGVPRSRIAGALGALFMFTIVIALAGKVFAGIEPDYGRLARLRWPLAYWNQLALLAAATVPLGLWLAGRRDRPLRARVAGTLHVYVALVAVVLTFSRYGIALAVLAAVAWIWIDRDRLDSLVALLVAAPVAGVVAGDALLLPGIADDHLSHSTRVHDGWIFGLLFVGGALVVGAAARSLLSREGNPVWR